MALAGEAEVPLPGQVILLPGAGDLSGLKRQGLDVWRDPEGTKAYIFDQEDSEMITRSGLDWKVSGPNISEPKSGRAPALPSGRKSYRYWEDYQREMIALARNYPEYARLVNLGETHEGRSILGLEIARQVWNEDGRPSFVQYGITHAREFPSGEIPMESAIQLIRDRDEPRISNILDQVRTIVIPVLNPDGFVAARGAFGRVSGGRFWGSGWSHYRRKNCRPGPHEKPGIPCAARKNENGGVDLNRNFSPYWGGIGASDWPQSDTYRGPRPLSEPESQALVKYLSGIQPGVVLSFHAYFPSGLWIRPPAFSDPLFPGDVTPDEPELKSLADSMAKATGWLSRKVTFLYPTNGSSSDWSYFNMGSLAPAAEIRGRDFHDRFSTMVAGEYPGVWEATLRAAERTADSTQGIFGSAPPGALLHLEKSIQVPSCADSRGRRDCPRPFSYQQQQLSAKIRVPADGLYRWSLLPSSRPLEVGETWTVSCGSGEGLISREISLARGQWLEQDWNGCSGGEKSLEIKDGITSRPGEKHVLVARAAAGPVEWDLDNDGEFDDAQGATASRVFLTPGRHQVRARDRVSEANHEVVIAPSWPTKPGLKVGHWVRKMPYLLGMKRVWVLDLVFRARGPAGSSYRWDFNRDGVTDARGAVVSRARLVRKLPFRGKVRVPSRTRNGAEMTRSFPWRVGPRR